jgi:O-antigen/teichoic acid export membrane protein
LTKVNLLRDKTLEPAGTLSAGSGLPAEKHANMAVARQTVAVLNVLNNRQSVQNTGNPATSHLVVRNTLYLTLSQVLAMPLSIITTAVAAHYLGPEAFGHAYFATTLCVMGFLAVGWGHEAVLPALISRNHDLAGVMLGSSLAWRALVSIPVYLVLALGCYAFGYSAELQWALGLSALVMMLTYFVASYKDTIRGLERTDIPAYAHFGQQLVTLIFVVIVLRLGGQLEAALLAHAAACAVILLAMWTVWRPPNLGRLRIRVDTMKTLFHEGTPFVIVGIVMALQPNIDAVFLSKLAPGETMGWYAASRRLVGTLLLPATTLIGALYPTLCRLYATDRQEFTRTANGALRGVSVLAVPAALACGLYPQIGVSLFNRQSFGPAEDNLRIMSVLVALVYFSMPLSTCILAAGKQRVWSLVQSLCVVASLVLDPILVPIFQQRTGNGGLGLCVAAVISEAFMIGFGIALAPAGVFDTKLRRVITLSIVAGLAMLLVARATQSVNPFISAPLALAAYAVVLWLTGGVDKSQLTMAWTAVGGRFARRVSTAA